MTNLLGVIFVVFVIGLGFAACWMITTHGAAEPAVQDSFGGVNNPETNASTAASAGLATSGMDLVPIAFFVAFLVVIAVTFSWFGRSGPARSKYH